MATSSRWSQTAGVGANAPRLGPGPSSLARARVTACYPPLVLPDWVFDASDRAFMAEALAEAQAAAKRGEVPVGAVVVRDGLVVARAGNRRQELHDPAGHAEVLALRAAAAARGDWRLEDCSMYVTLEPCPMCVWACREARLDLVVWGAPDFRAGACGTVLDLTGDPAGGRALAHRGGLEAGASSEILRAFFAKRR